MKWAVEGETKMVEVVDGDEKEIVNCNNTNERVSNGCNTNGNGSAVVDPRLEAISASIRVVPHFPKPGIMFNDITTLLLHPMAFKGAIDIFVDRYRNKGISVVAGIEARGFIFGPPIALAIGAKFVPLRKPNKLPGEVISEEYDLEYGHDCLQMHVGAVEPGEVVIIVDDLVATGGTLCAAILLLERAGAEVAECACVIGLPKFNGRFRLNGKPVYIHVMFGKCRSLTGTVNSRVSV